MTNEDIPLSPALIRAQYVEARRIKAEMLVSAELDYRRMTSLQAAERACARWIVMGIFE